VLTPADDIHHINKHNYKVPFVCGCRDLGEALRRIAEGAAMIRTKVILTMIEIKIIITCTEISM
jgi:pyridoxal biosynthesis lyase PdxS